MTRALILTALLAVPLAAAPNLSGNWVLNIAKSQYAQFPAPEIMTRQIRHQDPALSMSTYQKGAQGEVTTELKYSTDGQPAVNGANQGSAHWEGDKLVIESSREYQGTKLSQREEWTISVGARKRWLLAATKVPSGETEPISR